jgi:hypothetical protein
MEPILSAEEAANGYQVAADGPSTESANGEAGALTSLT